MNPREAQSMRDAAIESELLDFLADRLGDDTRTYVKSRQVAAELDEPTKKVGQILAAIDEYPPDDAPVSVSAWGPGYNGGTTWEVTPNGA